MVRNLITLIVLSLIVSSCLGIIYPTPNFDKMTQRHKIKTNGYYVGTYVDERTFENSQFDNKEAVFIKFDEDGYCIVFEMPFLKGENLEDIIERFQQCAIRSFQGRDRISISFTDGVYYFENNKLIIKRRRYNPHIYLYGGYENIYHEAFVVNENKIQYQKYPREFKFKKYPPEYVDLEFVEDNDLQFKNYFREKARKKQAR